MSGRRQSVRNSKGFSLIEVIVVITLASVLFAMMFSYFGTAVLDGARPVIRMNQALALTQVAERITEAYRQYRHDPDGLENLKNDLVNNPSDYGENYSIETKFIKFIDHNDEDAEDEDPKDILKVKISHDQTHETLTLLFSK